MFWPGVLFLQLLRERWACIRDRNSESEYSANPHVPFPPHRLPAHPYAAGGAQRADAVARPAEENRELRTLHHRHGRRAGIEIDHARPRRGPMPLAASRANAARRGRPRAPARGAQTRARRSRARRPPQCRGHPGGPPATRTAAAQRASRLEQARAGRGRGGLAESRAKSAAHHAGPFSLRKRNRQNSNVVTLLYNGMAFDSCFPLRNRFERGLREFFRAPFFCIKPDGGAGVFQYRRKKDR